jgi:hypothetical protein
VPVAIASAPVPREAKEFVRIVLDSGRTIEGWVDAGEPGRVMILDVFRVRDAGGREIVASPSDSFVLTAHIESFERLDGRSPELEANGRAGPAGAPKADGSPRDLAGSNESSGPSGNGRPLTM